MTKRALDCYTFHCRLGMAGGSTHPSCASVIPTFYAEQSELSVTYVSRQRSFKNEVERGSLPMLERTSTSPLNVTTDSYSRRGDERHERNKRQTDRRGINGQDTRRDQLHLSSINCRTPQGLLKEMKLPRQCLDCGAITQAGKSRCAVHTRSKRKLWDAGSVRNRKMRMQNGDGAAARLRAKVNREGGGYCVKCNDLYPAPMLNVDHIIRMASGGADEDENLQLLCKYHHNIKNRQENSS